MAPDLNDGKEKPDTPATLLETVGKSLTQKQDVDSDLAQILIQHMLVVPSNKACVGTAMAAITKLATKRASDPPEES